MLFIRFLHLDILKILYLNIMYLDYLVCPPPITLYVQRTSLLSQLLLDNCEQMRLSSSLHAIQNQVGGGIGLNKVITRIFINFFPLKMQEFYIIPLACG